ncbi:MAG: IS110 family transposase [Planctomycetes bacterium]|nr:IS110 family transposase [Planctomycetota bacterium]
MTNIAEFVGLDVHKDTIAIAYCEGGPLAEPVQVGPISSDIQRVIKALDKIGPRASLRVCYEAGPTGYGLCRALLSAGIECIVVAPGKVPKDPGRRVKTDERDARDLARLLRSGYLHGITLPDAAREALRDLVRAREDVLRDLRRARQRLKSMLLRHDRKWSGKSSWTVKFREWVRSQKFPAEADDIVLKHYLDEVEHLEMVRDHLGEQVERLVPTLGEDVLFRSLQALRGVSNIVAATVVTEIGDLTRFASAGRFMSYLGLVPSEHSSGSRKWRGPITKAGNGHVRRVMVEAAWAGRLRPSRSLKLLRRQEGLDPAIVDIAWKAQQRLHKRYVRLRGRGLPQNTVIIALARELAGFIWAVGQAAAQRPAA